MLTQAPALAAQRLVAGERVAATRRSEALGVGGGPAVLRKEGAVPLEQRLAQPCRLKRVYRRRACVDAFLLGERRRRLCAASDDGRGGGLLAVYNGGGRAPSRRLEIWE